MARPLRLPPLNFFQNFFLELQKTVFFLSGKAPPPHSVRATKKNTVIYCGFSKVSGQIVHRSNFGPQNFCYLKIVFRCVYRYQNPLTVITKTNKSVFARTFYCHHGAFRQHGCKNICFFVYKPNSGVTKNIIVLQRRTIRFRIVKFVYWF